MRYRFIVNPIAGRGDAQRKWSRIKEVAERLKMDFDTVFTSGPGEGVCLAREGVAAGFDALVAVGGDGTVNEVVRGIIESGGKGKTTLGIIPCGTGNDLVRTLNIPLEIEESVQVLKNGHIEHLDLGRVNGKYYMNVVGIGFDATVADEINMNVRRLKGTMAYLYAVLKTLFTYKSPKMTVQIDDTVLEGQYFLVAIANGKYYGGGMQIAPNAWPADGVFDICVVENVKRMEVVKMLPKIFKGEHLGHPAVKVYRGRKVMVESMERVLVQADGELMGTLPMGFELEPNVFPVLVP